MKRTTYQTRSSGQKQKGAAALEFAVVFILFFAVLYGIVSYGLLMLVKQGLTQAATEGARAAVRLNPLNFATTALYQTATEALARDASTNALKWLPSSSAATTTVSWINGTRLVTTGSTPLTIATKTITVKVAFANLNQAPLIPVLTLPGIGQVPQLPAELAGQATSQLYQ